MKTITIHKDKDHTINASQADTTYVVDRGAEIVATQGMAIDASNDADNRTFDIFGHLNGGASNFPGVIVGNDKHAALGSSVIIEKTAVVDDVYVGIGGFMESGLLANHGIINASGTSGAGLGYIGDDGRLINTGSVQADFGVEALGSNNVVRNSGSIEGRIGVGIVSNSAADHSLLLNTGRISGSQTAIVGQDGEQTIVNKGVVKGSIVLGADDDVYKGADGRSSGLIDGEGGDDRLIGGAKVDHLAGGSGHDVLTGHGGADVFVFATGSQADTITDFHAEGSVHDRLDFSHTGFLEIGDIVGLMTQNGDDTVIDLGNGDVLTLEHVTSSKLSGDDFLF